MTVKECVNEALKMGMTEFEIQHFRYNGRTHKQTKETVFDFIRGYEDDVVVTCYFGSGYSYWDSKTDKQIYTAPTLCFITLRGKNEGLTD